MELVLIILAWSTCFFLVFTLIEFIIGFKKIKNLSLQPLHSTHLPSVSIILSVLNEADNIESVIHSLSNLDYPQLEIIVINDRSKDQTPDILNRLKLTNKKLQVHHIDSLPSGWFGKNHALHIGSQFAKGEWLLFTDADVTMRNDTLLKAVSYALQHQLDHLTVHELHVRHNVWLKLSLLGYYICYSLDMKPWRIRYNWSKKSLGRGAFNLIKKTSYQHCGGHQAIAMECLDDLRLGELLKKAGFKQDVANALDHVQFDWYGSLNEMIRGLQKNSFAYRDYKWWATIRDLIFANTFFLWPFIAVFFFSNQIRWINVVNVGLMIGMGIFVAHQYRLKKRYGLCFPLAMSITFYTVFNSLCMTYKNKGIIWRGTHYSLAELKKNTRKKSS